MAAPLALSAPRRLFAAGCLLMLGACSTISFAPPPPATYMLEPLAASAVAVPPPRYRTIVVPRPTSPSSLDSSRIRIGIGQYRKDTVAEALWADRIPGLVQRLFVDSITTQGGRATADEAAPLESVRLEIDVRSFEAAFASARDSEPPVAVVRLGLTIERNDLEWPRRTVVEGRATAASADLEAIIAAQDAATKQAMVRAIGWAFERAVEEPTGRERERLGLPPLADEDIRKLERDRLGVPPDAPAAASPPLRPTDEAQTAPLNR